MIIRTIKVTNFKKHRELSLAFNEKLNLIGGPNEAGKSTIAEAIHAALFYKHSGNSQQLRDLQSLYTQDGPSVELELDFGNTAYVVKKAFLKGAGCTISSASMQTLTGAKAEEKLDELLASSANTSTHSQAKGEWAHLWVWQGTSGDNPSGIMATQQEKMLNQLQDAGVMVALASEKDQRVATHFSTKYHALFTSNGKYKAGSTIKTIYEQLSKSEEDLQKTKDKIAEMEEDIKSFSAKSEQLTQLKQDLADMGIARDTYRSQMDMLNQLEVALAEEKQKLEKHAEHESELRDRINTIKELREAIVALEDQLAPLKNEYEKKENELKALKAHIQEAKNNRKGLEDQKQKEAIKKEFLHLVNTIHQKSSEEQIVKKSLDKIRSLENEKSEFLKKLGNLPQIERKDLDTWNELEANLRSKREILKSIATEIELLTSNHTLSIQGEKLSDKRLLTEETILEIEGSPMLKILPGGGKSLQLATEEEKNAGQKFEDLKRKLGKQDKGQIDKVIVEREYLQKRIQTAKDKLSTLKKAEEEEHQLQEIRSTLSQLTIRKANLVTNDQSLDVLNEQNSSRELQEVEEIVSDLVQKIDALKNQIDQKEESYNRLEEGRAVVFGRYTTSLGTLTEEKAKLNLLRSQAGNTDEQIQKIRAEKEAVEKACEQVKASIEKLEPEKLRTDFERTEHAIGAKSATLRELEFSVVRLEEKLKLSNNGDSDSYQKLQSDFARHEYHQAVFEGYQNEANAIKLLDELFRQEKDELTKNYAQPFAEKVKTYLSFIFGTELEIAVNSDDRGQFTGLDIYRANYRDLGRLAFDKLSGGTKEQVAAAVRLAMAEILAPAYGGNLPIVFDDAFGFSDPERLNSLHNMLFRASENGLQVILLSCNSKDYRSLGATELVLQ
ncbi:AAA family ATPase [Cyclobacterium xiamenense]|uniref:AAA family ATPase n=1 Tax=Cyclobacterium xiamenense TaxID=1297121 RepID=UPI0012B751D8|nr:SMC family ATPase [Cyclobacterium xiamenense]